MHCTMNKAFKIYTHIRNCVFNMMFQESSFFQHLKQNAEKSYILPFSNSQKVKELKKEKYWSFAMRN